MSETVKVTGLQELNRKLARLADDVQRKYLRGAVGAGARIFRDAAKRNAPVGTGKLQRSIISKWIPEASSLHRQLFLVTVKRGKHFRGKVKTDKKGRERITKSYDAYYWTWIEFGHTTRLSGQKRTRAQIRKSLDVYKATGRFVPPRPFLRPAFESNKSAAIEAVRVELAKRIAEGAR